MIEQLTNPDPWMIVAEDSGPGPEYLGRVLAHTQVNTEEEAHIFDYRRGELCDFFGLYLDCDIPDDFTVEVMQYSEFKRDYGNRMPLRNFVDFYKK